MKKKSRLQLRLPCLLAAVFLFIFGDLCLAQQEKPSGRDIMVLENNRPDGDDRHMVMTMRLINRRGRERVRTVETLSKDYGKDKKSVMMFQKPADVRGTMLMMTNGSICRR